MSTRAIVRPEGSPTLRYCHESHRVKQEVKYSLFIVFRDLVFCVGCCFRL